MPNQVSEEWVKAEFDRVLKTVQETSKLTVGKYEGTIQEVLVEEMNEQDSTLVSGRMSNNTLVHFPGDASLIGTLQNVRLEECHGFYYIGQLAN